MVYRGGAHTARRLSFSHGSFLFRGESDPKTYAARATALGAKFEFAFVSFFAVTALRSRHPEHSLSSHVDPNSSPHLQVLVEMEGIEPSSAKNTQVMLNNFVDNGFSTKCLIELFIIHWRANVNYYLVIDIECGIYDTKLSLKISQAFFQDHFKLPS